jgi:hypothetical protein
MTLRAMRGLVGLVAIMSLVLVVFPETAEPADPVSLHVSACQPEMSADDSTLDLADCGLSGHHSGCISHSGCLAFTVPMTYVVFASVGARQWTLPVVNDQPGLSVLLGTPPPILAA